MTFTALIYATVFVILILALAAWHFWPRHDDGSPYSAEEVDEVINRSPKHPKSDGSRIMLVLIGLIALIAVALSGGKHDSPHSPYDN